MNKFYARMCWCVLIGLALAGWNAPLALGQQVTYKPYIELGDAGAFGPSDQMVVTWQTNEASPNPARYSLEFGQTLGYGSSMTPAARVGDNYLSAGPALPVAAPA